MRLHTIIPCLHYDDFLALTLPTNRNALASITVLTSPTDERTRALAAQLDTPVFLTDAFSLGGTFNKPRALNEWLDHITALDPEAWVLSLDADTLVLQPIAPLLPTLDPAALYSLPRRMCALPQHFADLLTGRRTLETLPLHTLPLLDGKLWGFAPTSNPAGLNGYFQLWCPRHSAGAHRFPDTGSAEHYDYQFGLTFPEHLRHNLHGVPPALHLGPAATNWNGRRSPRWQLHPTPPPASNL